MPCQLTRDPPAAVLREAERQIRCPRNADARTRDDTIGGYRLTGTEPDGRPVELVAVVGAGDAERGGQTGGPAAQRGIEKLFLPDESARTHVVDTVQRLERADEHGGGKTPCVRHHIQTPVNAVNAVYVRDAGRAEHGFVARGAADALGGMRCIVVRPYVRFGFDDAATRFDAVDSRHEVDAEQLARDELRGPGEEG